MQPRRHPGDFCQASRALQRSSTALYFRLLQAPVSYEPDVRGKRPMPSGRTLALACVAVGPALHARGVPRWPGASVSLFCKISSIVVPLGKALGRRASLSLLVSGDCRHSLAFVCTTLVLASLLFRRCSFSVVLWLRSPGPFSFSYNPAIRIWWLDLGPTPTEFMMISCEDFFSLT